MLGLFLLFKADQVSDNITSRHQQFAREKKARIQENPRGSESLMEASKEMAFSLWACTCLITMGIMAIGAGTFWGSFMTLPCAIASGIALVVGAIVGPIVCWVENK